MNKAISFSIAIIIIIVCAILVSGIFVWQYLKEELPPPRETILEKEKK